MSTLSTRLPSAHDWIGRITTALARWLAAVDDYLAETLEQSRRSEQERYLSQANDLYELERLERQWERRRLDAWTAR